MPDDPKANAGENMEGHKNAESGAKGPHNAPAIEPDLDVSVALSGEHARGDISAREDEQKRQTILERATVWQKWCAVAIAVFTFFQVIVGYWQWDATDKQYKAMLSQNELAQGQLRQAKIALEHSEKTLTLMQLDERPWFIVDVQVARELEAEKSFDFVVTVTNSGKSAGTLVGQNTITVPLPVPDGNPGVGGFTTVHGGKMIEIKDSALDKIEARVSDYTMPSVPT